MGALEICDLRPVFDENETFTHLIKRQKLYFGFTGLRTALSDMSDKGCIRVPGKIRS